MVITLREMRTDTAPTRQEQEDIGKKHSENKTELLAMKNIIRKNLKIRRRGVRQR